MDTSRDRRQYARRPFRARVTVSLPTPQVSVEGNVLDISLNGKSSMPIADALRQRGLPFMFASGYPPNPDEAGFKGVPLLQKPFDMRQVEAALEHETFRAI